MNGNKITFRNVWIWTKDQLSHPASLFKRKTWGVFSVYAHVRRSDGKPKNTYNTKEQARKAADFMTQKYGGRYSVYKCLYCAGWHVAKEASADTKPIEVIASMPLWNVVPLSSSLDVERILKLDIPDIASAYGGVRGRTMSSRHQNFAGPIIKDCGIHTIIELRKDAAFSRMNELCAQYGMDYFYFPIGKNEPDIAEMIEKFPEFCQKIDAGNFYIACAMGLHRTDIALCAYWTFHGADKGIQQPVLRGYSKESGHTTVKIMRTLNAMYKEMVNQHVTTIQPEVFNARKKYIESLR